MTYQESIHPLDEIRLTHVFLLERHREEREGIDTDVTQGDRRHGHTRLLAFLNVSNQIDDWLQKISEGKIDRALQNDITDKILALLEQRKASLGVHDKILFAQAVTALSTSLDSTYQPNEAGLRRCLLILQKVVNPENETAEMNSQRQEAEQVSYAMLVTTVKIIKGEIAKNW